MICNLILDIGYLLLVIGKCDMVEKDAGGPSPTELQEMGVRERRRMESLVMIGEILSQLGINAIRNHEKFIYPKTGGLRRMLLFKIIREIEGLTLPPKTLGKNIK